MAVLDSSIKEPMVELKKEALQDLKVAQEKEWLIANGIGGFASSTAVGLNTRRYHGLLVAATKPPLGRMVLVSKLDEILVTPDGKYELGTNRYTGIVHPEGFKYLDEFKLSPFPAFIFKIGDIVLEKTIFMVYGQNTTVVSYRLLSSDKPVELITRPLLACRDYHWLIREDAKFNTSLARIGNTIRLRPYETSPNIFILHDAEKFEPSSYWYKNFEYRQEERRGLDYIEDLYSPGYFIHILKQDETCYFVLSTKENAGFDYTNAYNAELERKAALIGPHKNATHADHRSADTLFRSLVLAADNFLVRDSENLWTVIAGYHWFDAWGRDSLISLPGLALATGRFDVAKSILKYFARKCDQGIIPNRLSEWQEPEYNTIDASLWFFWAVQKYLEYTKDYDFVKQEVLEKMIEIIYYYVNGTRYNIKMDRDGLISGGEEGVQLTWMDARIEGAVVTPRTGKPVEVNALWYNALRLMEDLAVRYKFDKRVKYSELISAVRENFNILFWCEEKGYLYDCIHGRSADDSLRPNQIIAISVPHDLVPKDRAKKIWDNVFRELYTPYGLRTLSPRDKNYRGKYDGNQKERDMSYHQGTVWPWLLGHFITAYTRVSGKGNKSREDIEKFLEPFRAHIKDAGLGSVSEIFDANPPHTARGAISQAWSCAEILRVYIEEYGEV